MSGSMMELSNSQSKEVDLARSSGVRRAWSQPLPGSGGGGGGGSWQIQSRWACGEAEGGEYKEGVTRR